jgi:2-methylisocitrate lyase-like PEP mutase family enzyme
MPVKTQKDKAAHFLRLHDRQHTLVLPNAWDVASARVFEEAGFPAVASTSAGVAWALGYPDGERVSRAEMVEVVRRIAGAVAVPVTADMEAGYGPEPRDVAETARAVIAAGAVGMNLEDSIPDAEAVLFEVAAQEERIRAARQASASVGVPLVINARVDVYLFGVGEEAGRLDHSIRRANAYRQAGADCVFVPGVRDAATIGILAREVQGPLNVLAGPGTPSVTELQRLGVARLSIGSGGMRAALSLTRRVAEELRGPGTYTCLTQEVLTHAEVNRLLAPRHGA